MIFPNFKPINKNSKKILNRGLGSEEYDRWRAYVLARDDNKCQMCGDLDGLQIHHIHTFAKVPHLRFNTFNGISLCSKCHRKTFGKEEFYAVTFVKKAIINDRKYNGEKK